MDEPKLHMDYRGGALTVGYDEDGADLCVNVTHEGILIDAYPEGIDNGCGDPVSLAMTWSEWLHFTLEHGVA
jgi:hypothetical protein